MIAMAAQARNIDARKGGSIEKKRISAEISASMLAMIATTRLTLRNWFILANSSRPRPRPA